MTWRDQAACQGKPVDWWFPVNNEHLAAVAVCKKCPVQADCLEHALTVPEYHGIWGGTSERERERLRRQRRRVA